jgi:hypothetical protein
MAQPKRAALRLQAMLIAVREHRKLKKHVKYRHSGFKVQTVCKPGSVHTCVMNGHSSGTDLTARLARPTRAADRKHSRTLASPQDAGRPYSVLLPVGFTLPISLPKPRCALTAPFHPYPICRNKTGGLFSVALSLGSPPPDVIRHRISVEPGLSSTNVFTYWQRPSNRLDFRPLAPMPSHGQPAA